MTREEINALVPEELTCRFTEADYKFLAFHDEDGDIISELKQLRAAQLDVFIKKAGSLRLSSPVVVWYVWPKTNEEKCQIEVTAKTMGVTSSEVDDAYAVAQHFVLMTFLGEVVSMTLRSPLEYLMITGHTFGMLCYCATEEDSEKLLSAYANIFFEALAEIDDKWLGKIISLLTAQTKSELLPLILIARIFAEESKKQAPQKNWWRAVYRTLHDYDLRIARDEGSFVLYMVDHLAEWQRLAKAFGVPNKLAKPDFWKLTRMGKPAVDKVSPLSHGGTGNYYYYSDTPWSCWKDDFKKLFLESIHDAKAKEEIKKFGPTSDILKTMIRIATQLTEWLNLLSPPKVDLSL